MYLAQGKPFVLSYRYNIIGLAQECNRMTCRVCFTILFHSFKPSKFSARQSARLTTSLAAGALAQLTVTGNVHTLPFVILPIFSCF